MSRRTRQIVSTVATVALLLAVWWIQNRGADDDTSARGRDEPTSSSTQQARSSGSARPSSSSSKDRDSDGFRYVAVEDLPREAGETLELIDDGGPFPYPGKDGSTFGNFEGELPDHKLGYYAEYTVETPGLSHRGARRIIAGDGGEFYWTADHYESFERIRR